MENAKIYPAIANVMAAIGAVGKDKKNSQQGFMYRGIDDVMNALNPALVENKVFAVPEVLESTREDRVTSKGNPIIYSVAKVRYTFYAEDGSNVQAVVIGEGMDSGDKSMNKAMSIAFKYACFQVFCIPTEEMKDPDAESHELAPRQQAGQQKPAAQSTKTTGRSSGCRQATQQQAQQDPPPMPAQQEPLYVNANHIATLRSEMARTGVAEETVLAMARVEKMEQITMAVFKSLMNKFKKTETRPPAPEDSFENVDDALAGEELPFV